MELRIQDGSCYPSNRKWKEIFIEDRSVLVSSHGEVIFQIWNGKYRTARQYPGGKNGRYHRVSIGRQYIYVHRLVAYAFGLCPTFKHEDGYSVDHIDGVGHHNSLDNLRYVTDAENKALSDNKRRANLKHTWCVYKVNNEEEFVLRSKSLTEVAKFIGVDKSFVCQVAAGKKPQCKGYKVRKLPDGIYETL